MKYYFCGKPIRIHFTTTKLPTLIPGLLGPQKNTAAHIVRRIVNC